MQIFSYARRGIDLEPIEIEITLVPGLPAFHLIGLPDAAIRESLLRIKSAIRHQGFQLPKREQVLINLKPTFEKKTSQGLDLAIAIAYLHATEQIQIANLGDEIYLYGELSLTGEVISPSDIELLDSQSPGPVITGLRETGLHIPHGRVATLANFPNEILWCEPEFSRNENDHAHRDFSQYSVAKSIADLLTVAAAGEHSVFLAGPAGTGKTTFSEMLHALLRSPSAKEWSQIEKIHRLFKTECAGRPLISPHHSATEQALLGGGAPPRPGEITRAHHGLLVLDEYLEFDVRVKEALREPIERHEITVSRVNGRLTFPADFLLMATTNLCPCGEYVPGTEPSCAYGKTRCQSYYSRMTGPMLDRFEVVAFSHKWKSEKKVPWTKLKEKVRAAQEFAEKRGQTKMNSRLTPIEVEQLVAKDSLDLLLPELPGSHRRRLALVKVARTLADLQGSASIEGPHLEQAMRLTLAPFKAIKEAWH